MACYWYILSAKHATGSFYCVGSATFSSDLLQHLAYSNSADELISLVKFAIVFLRRFSFSLLFSFTKHEMRARPSRYSACITGGRNYGIVIHIVHSGVQANSWHSYIDVTLNGAALISPSNMHSLRRYTTIRIIRRVIGCYLLMCRYYGAPRKQIRRCSKYTRRLNHNLCRKAVG